MGFEYVALSWRALDAEADRPFQADKCGYIGAGWEEYIRAPLPSPHFGGVCIMRRPKDELGLEKWHRLYRECYGVDPPNCFFLSRLAEDEPRKWRESELLELMRVKLKNAGGDAKKRTNIVDG